VSLNFLRVFHTDRKTDISRTARLVGIAKVNQTAALGSKSGYE
jgi:hypothetical protein